MSIVFESGHRSSFLADESYPNIDQASEEVERYDEADNNNNVSDVMHDVDDLGVGVPVTVSYHTSEQSILAESEPSRVLDVGGVVVDSADTAHSHSHPHGLPEPADMNADLNSDMNPEMNPDMNSDINSAAAAAVANIAAAEAVRAAAAAAQHNLSAAQALQQSTSLAPPSPGSSLKETSTPSSSGMAMASMTTPQRVKPISKPDRDVQKNGQGVYQCTWPNCTEDVTTFNRKCEYNKHMDKHERPYQCTADGCQKLPGFTYSGGLLRHEREVHGKHGGPRNPLHCPHPTCKRHTGKGFSRAENLNEHLRRVHTLGGTGVSGSEISTAAATATPPIMSSLLGEGHVTTASVANGLVSTAGASSSSVSASATADALLAHTSNGLLMGSLDSLSSVLRSIPVLPISPPNTGGNGDNNDDNNGVINGVNLSVGSAGSSSDDNTSTAAAAAAAAVAAAAANAVAGRFPSSAILGGVSGSDVVDSENAKSMEDSINLILQTSPSAANGSGSGSGSANGATVPGTTVPGAVPEAVPGSAQSAPATKASTPRGRKRTAGAMLADDGLDDGALSAYHGQHEDLRDEMKRLRQENQEQRHQLDLQKQQTNALVLQINALRQLVAQNVQAQVQAQVQQVQAQVQQAQQAQQAQVQHDRHTQHTHKQHKLGSSATAHSVLDEPASPASSSLQDPTSMLG